MMEGKPRRRHTDGSKRHPRKCCELHEDRKPGTFSCLYRLLYLNERWCLQFFSLTTLLERYFINTASRGLQTKEGRGEQEENKRKRRMPLVFLLERVNLETTRWGAELQGVELQGVELHAHVFILYCVLIRMEKETTVVTSPLQRTPARSWRASAKKPPWRLPRGPAGSPITPTWAPAVRHILLSSQISLSPSPRSLSRCCTFIFCNSFFATPTAPITFFYMSSSLLAPSFPAPPLLTGSRALRQPDASLRLLPYTVLQTARCKDRCTKKKAWYL